MIRETNHYKGTLVLKILNHKPHEQVRWYLKQQKQTGAAEAQRTVVSLNRVGIKLF